MKTKINHKPDPADIEAGKWLGEQEAISKKRRLSDRLLLILVSVCLVFFGAAIYILPSSDFSEAENRVLAPFPEFSLEAVASGEFMRGIGEFYADRFPFRDAFVGIKAGFEKLLLKGENNGALDADDGYIIDRLEYTDAEYENIRTNLAAINRFAENTENTVVALAPRSIDVMKSKLPALYSTERADRVWEIVAEAAPDALILTDALRAKADGGEYVWYKTDHHYTTLGAYYTYVALGESLGYTPYPIEFFTQETASGEFLGTTYSSSGIKWAERDTVTFFRFDGDLGAAVKYGNGETLLGFYDRSYLEKKDKYSAFLGGNRARVTVTLGGEAKPTLLLVKDSFSNSLVPFLSLHFDIEMVDLRYYTQSTYKLCEEINPDKVLVFYGIDSLASSTEAERIVMGMG